MTEIKSHSCEFIKLKEKELKIIPFEGTWVLHLNELNINVYDIKYCPYCGEELTKKV